jgi:hypothetical protein
MSTSGDVTHIHERSLSWLGTGISITSGDVTHIHDRSLSYYLFQATTVSGHEYV